MEMFLSSENGKRTLNFVYSCGASIVIIGALFKILHHPLGSPILSVAMVTEALVVFISACERRTASALQARQIAEDNRAAAQTLAAVATAKTLQTG